MKKSTIIDGKYEVLKKIGEGGMASIYLGRDLSTSEEIVIKVATITSKTKGFSLRRFKREFSLSARVQHSNIINQHAFGKLSENTYYTVMDYVKGQDLSELIDEIGNLEERQVLHIALQTARALKVLHEAEVIHRDLKPANIMVREKSTDNLYEPIIMDFGLARAIDLTALTETGTILGTPVYMAPEQTQGTSVDHRSDIYQLGAIMFELLTGKPAFDGHTIAELLSNILEQEAPKVSDFTSMFSPKWDNLVARCLEKDPDLRYQSAGELIRALEDLVKDGVNLSESKAMVDINDNTDGAPTPSLSTQSTMSVLPAQNKSLLLAAVLGLTLAFLVFSFAAKEKEGFDCLDLKISTSVNEMTLSWQSSTPYPTVVQLFSPFYRQVKSTRGGKTTKHNLIVTGLAEGTPHTFKILYPNGEMSLPQKATTKRFQVSLYEAKVAKNKITLWWNSSPRPLKYTIKTKPNSFTTSLSKDTEIGTLAVSLIGPSRKLKNLEFKAHFPNKRIKTFTLRELLRADVDIFNQTLRVIPAQNVLDDIPRVAGVAPAAFFKKLSNGDAGRGPIIRQEKGEKLTTLFSSLMNDYPSAFKMIPRVCRLSSLVLSTRILPLAEKARFDQALNPIMAIHAFCAYETHHMKPYSLPDRGGFSFAAKPLRETCDEVVIEERDKDNPLRLGIPMPVRAPAQKYWSKKFIINDLKKYVEAELAFDFLGFDNARLWIRFNGSLELQLLGHRALILKGLKPYQRFPYEVLRQGENTLELRYQYLSRGHMDAQIHLRRCVLRLYEGDA